jgi:hypothetical protein
MGVELPSVGAIIHDGRVRACRIEGVFLVDKNSATEFDKKREPRYRPRLSHDGDGQLTTAHPYFAVPVS